MTMVLTSWIGSLLLCRTSFNLPRTKFPFHVLLVKFGSCFVLNLSKQEIEFKIMLRIYFLQFSYLTVASYAWVNVFSKYFEVLYQQKSFKYFSFEIFKFKKRIPLELQISDIQNLIFIIFKSNKCRHVLFRRKALFTLIF